MIYSKRYKIYFLFYQLIECWSSFVISWCKWNWSHDKDYILGIADLLCHVTKNPNPNCKPVSGFQNLLKSAVAYIKNFPIKKSSLSAISVWHGDAGDVVASPTLKNWPLSGQKFWKFGQSIQLHSHVMRQCLFCKLRQNINQINGKIMAKTAK